MWLSGRVSNHWDAPPSRASVAVAAALNAAAESMTAQGVPVDPDVSTTRATSSGTSTGPWTGPSTGPSTGTGDGRTAGPPPPSASRSAATRVSRCSGPTGRVRSGRVTDSA